MPVTGRQVLMGSPCQPSYLMGLGGRALKSSTRSLRVSVLAAGCGVSTSRSRHSAIWCCCFFPDDGFDPVRHVSRRLARGGRRGAERRASPKRGRPGRGPPVNGLHVQFGTEASDQVVISWHTLQDVTDPRVLVGTEREGSHRSTPARTRPTRRPSPGWWCAHHAPLSRLSAATDHLFLAVHDGSQPEAGSVTTARRQSRESPPQG